MHYGQLTGLSSPGMGTLNWVIALGGPVAGGFIGHHYATKSPTLGTIVGVVAGGLAAAFINVGIMMSKTGTSSDALSPAAAHAVQPPGQGAYTNASYTTGGAMSTLDVQKALNSLGAAPPLTEDGINGPLTTNAVRAFQQTMGIQVDGVVGPQTVAAINTALNALGTAQSGQLGTSA